MTTETWHKIVEVGDVEKATVAVEMTSGELKLMDGAESLLDGTFAYAAPDWRPEVSYEIDEGAGRLLVRPPQGRRIGHPAPDYVWDLHLGHAIPVDLDVKLGSGRAALDLAETKLLNLSAQLGSGQVQVNLSGDQPDLTQVGLTSGSGRLACVLQGSFPLLSDITLKNASGITDVALGGAYAALKRLRFASASGGINVGLAGELPALEHLDIKVASGAVDLNLTEAVWESLDLSLDCVSGVATVRYPPAVGVFVRFSSVTGRLDAEGMVVSAGGYVTPNYEGASRTLNVSMSTVSGKLTLQPSET